MAEDQKVLIRQELLSSEQLEARALGIPNNRIGFYPLVRRRSRASSFKSEIDDSDTTVRLQLRSYIPHEGNGVGHFWVCGHDQDGVKTSR